MSTTIGLIGNLIAAIGLVAFVRPGFLRQTLLYCEEGQRLLMISLFRVALGAFMVYAAPQTGHSQVIWIVGLILIVAGLVGLLMGRDRLVGMLRWWVSRSDAVARLWSLVAVAFGVLIWWAR